MTIMCSLCVDARIVLSHAKLAAMVPSFVLDPFQLLLNNLSDELHERNLHSLIHVCGDLIPGAQRERITTGWDAFTILRQRNVIGSEPEKMKNLLAIIKELRPNRKDLVLKIKRHIQDNYQEPDLILNDLDSSSDSPLPFRVISRPSTSTSHIPQEDCCRIHCSGLACSCNPCCGACCCCVILAILFTLLALVTLTAWSLASKDEHSDHEISREAVPCVVGAFGFLAVCSVISVIYIRYCRPRDQLNYTMLPTTLDMRTNLASYATSDSLRTSYNSMGQRIESPRYECSCSQSGQNTASSSLTSRASSVPSHPLLPDDIVPDGFPWDDYPEFFHQNVQDEEVNLLEV